MAVDTGNIGQDALKVELGSSSDVLNPLSILHLIRFFDSGTKTDFGLREDTDMRTSSSLSESKEQPLSAIEEQSLSSNFDKLSGDEGNEEKLNDDRSSKTASVEVLGKVAKSTHDEESSLHLLDTVENLVGGDVNFRPREQVEEKNDQKLDVENSASNSTNGKHWIRRSASLFFPLLSEHTNGVASKKEDGSLKEGSIFRNSPSLSFRKLKRCTAKPEIARRTSSPFSARKLTSETQLEDMVFLPRTHRPSLHDYPTVEDVEDIAEARAEYSVLPEEWSGYLDPMMKSSGHLEKPKRVWDSWLAPSMKIRALLKKIKSSLASGKRKTLTLKVRFFSPTSHREAITMPQQSPRGFPAKEISPIR